MDLWHIRSYLCHQLIFHDAGGTIEKSLHHFKESHIVAIHIDAISFAGAVDGGESESIIRYSLWQLLASNTAYFKKLQ